MAVNHWLFDKPANQATESNVVLVGCGEIGAAMLRRWLATQCVERVVVISRGSKADVFREDRRVQILKSPEQIPENFVPRAIILAVMTHDMREVAPMYQRFVKSGSIFLTVAAGLTFKFYSQVLTSEALVVRAMPNTPAFIGSGATLAVANDKITDTHKLACSNLLAPLGDLIWVDNEEWLDPATAIAGGGPAYVFLLVDCMTHAGVAAGLPADIAARLARSTVAGAGGLLKSSFETTDELILNVARPGGVTRRALEVLNGPNGISPIFKAAIVAATKRAREMSGSNSTDSSLGRL